MYEQVESNVGLSLSKLSGSPNLSIYSRYYYKFPADNNSDKIATISEPKAMIRAPIAIPVVIFHRLYSGNGNTNSGFSASSNLPFAFGMAPNPSLVATK